MLSRRRFMNDRIASENGDNLVLQNVKGSKMNALTVYGKSTQDGTPSPENPVPIVSAGDEGEINVEISDGGTQSQTLVLSTPGGLPGIPVASGGNYTDGNGQQWICDEVDFKRGKYVQRVAKRIVESSDIHNIEKEKQNTNLFGIGSITPPATNRRTIGGNYLYCNILDSVPDELDVYVYDSPGIGYTSGANFIRLNMSNTGAGESVETFKNYLDTMQESGNPVYILYIIATPIETDLPAEEIAAYKALHTYSPTTTVSNDAGAWMKVGYREWRR